MTEQERPKDTAQEAEVATKYRDPWILQKQLDQACKERDAARAEAVRVHDEAEERFFLLYGRFPLTPRQPYGGDLGIDEDYREQMERY